jgi:WS/DGAT/MGAT family acyltransferase
MSESKTLNLLDLSFVLMESRQTPMHVAGLQTFSLPADAPRDYTKHLFEYLRRQPITAPPFNFVLRGLKSGHLLPTFETSSHIDLDYHLRHSALPYPGGERELGVLVSRLHSNPLDFSRPLWEMHLIEGLHGNRFALYTKLHHSLADGVSGVGLLSFSDDPAESDTPPMWAVERERRSRDVHDARSLRALGVLSTALRDQARALPNLIEGLAGTVKAALGLKPVPEFASLTEAPRTIFNVDVTPHRRVATQAVSLARMKAISRAAGGSVNDVLLAACSGALRRYLGELGELPKKSLIASIPVALPRDTSRPGGGGNAISFANVRLASDIDDLRERFELVRRSSAAGREHLRKMGPAALMTYTVLISSPQMLTRLPAIGSRIPPIYNVIVSNVPGPRRRLYFHGAELETYYPISALAHGQALNITVLSYAGRLHIAVTACADRVPHVQRLAVCIGEAIDELETVFVGQDEIKPVRMIHKRGNGAAQAHAQHGTSESA